jgi:uncharacterized membrane protein YphA (DoxX/SURF4 family)
MKFSLGTAFKKYFVEIVSSLFILLFIYAAVSKLMDFGSFRAQIGQSPLLSPFADLISVGVIAAEMIISVLLAVPKAKYLALWLAAELMAMFTAYIVIILNFSSFIPCSCGGILEKMGWGQHLVFNIAFLLIAMAAIKVVSKGNGVLLKLFGAVTASAGIVVVLFVFSEDIMEKENPFIRRFPIASAAKTNKLDLRNYSYYVAGAHDDKIYLGNWKAPLEIFETDSNFKRTVKHIVLLDRESFIFKAIEVRIHYPYFYVMDGTVPVIYRGLVSDWKASVLTEGKFHFSSIAFLDATQFAFRTQKPPAGENIMGYGIGYPAPKIKYSDVVFEKQNDGIFDTDGTLQYSDKLQKIVFTYYYRNQYIIAENNLKVKARPHTIDTTIHAKLKVVKLEKSGDIKLAAPPYTVNRNTSVFGKLLFVNSMLRGRYEDSKVWKNATVIDVYDIAKQTYVLSFYVYDQKQNVKMGSFFAADSALYVISGHYLLKYAYGKRINSRIK